MGEYLFLFARSGGLFALMFVFFVSGFAMKVIAGIFYDLAIENATLLLTGQCKGVAKEIVEEYRNKYSKEKECKNTRVFVDNSLHKWKKCGIFVERFDDFGNVVAGIGIFICVFFVMIMMIEKTFENTVSDLYMRYIYIYSMISVIIIIAIKGFELFVNTDNKKDRLRDLLVDYLDNHFDETVKYVKLDKENSVSLEEMSCSFLSNENDNEKINRAKESGIVVEKENMSVEGKDIYNVGDMANSEEKRENIENKLDKKDKERVISQVLDEFLTE